MGDSIKFTLDGKVVFANDDETIWEVAKREGTNIPHLCHSGETAVSYTHLTLPTKA